MVKKLIFIVILAVAAVFAVGCTDKKPTNEESGDMEKPQSRIIYVIAGGEVMEAELTDNSSADAFYALLGEGDVVIDMHDYGSFEKVGELGRTLPRNDESITTSPGDIILYLGNNVTIYYDKNTWSFTKLGHIIGATKDGLKRTLGDGNVTVTFTLSAK